MSEAEAPKNECLVVASKVKNYIRESSQLNTSAAVMDILSAQVKSLCDKAVENAKKDGRKTVMDRDFPGFGGSEEPAASC